MVRGVSHDFFATPSRTSSAGLGRSWTTLGDGLEFSAPSVLVSEVVADKLIVVTVVRDPTDPSSNVDVNLHVLAVPAPLNLYRASQDTDGLEKVLADVAPEAFP